MKYNPLQPYFKNNVIPKSDTSEALKKYILQAINVYINIANRL